MELNISTHVAVPKKLDSRKRWFSSLAFERTSATRTNPRANANTERTATTRTKRWMFVVRPDRLNCKRIVASIYSLNELNIPNPSNPEYFPLLLFDFSL